MIKMFSNLRPLNIVLNQDENTTDLVARSGHRLVIEDKYLYCWGGYNPEFWDRENTEDTEYPLLNELWRYQIWTGEWKLLKTHGEVPTELASHTVLMLPDHILHFGGTGVPFGQAKTNCLYDLDLNTLEWKRVCHPDPDNDDTDIPREKYGHASVRVGNLLYVIGGTCGYVYDSDIHQLNLETLNWKEICAKSDYIPQARYRHEIIYYKGKLLMFGGGSGVDSYPLSKIDVFHLDTQTWESVVTIPCENNTNDNSANPVSNYPCGRRCHSCVQFEDNVYICGGLAPGKVLGDIWQFHLPTYQWTKLPVMLPKPVYFHSAVISNYGCMYVFGGVSKIDTERTNALQIMWLKIPQLKLCAFNAILKRLNLTKCDNKKETLLEIGIPYEFVDLIL